MFIQKFEDFAIYEHVYDRALAIGSKKQKASLETLFDYLSKLDKAKQIKLAKSCDADGICEFSAMGRKYKIDKNTKEMTLYKKGNNKEAVIKLDEEEFKKIEKFIK